MQHVKTKVGTRMPTLSTNHKYGTKEYSGHTTFAMPPLNLLQRDFLCCAYRELKSKPNIQTREQPSPTYKNKKGIAHQNMIPIFIQIQQ
jgi:hypothetical protein